MLFFFLIFMVLVIVQSHLALIGYGRLLTKFKWNETSVLMVHLLEDTSFFWIGFSCRCEQNTRKSIFIKTNKQGRRTMEDKSWCNTWGSWEAWCWWWASACSFEVWRCISGSVFDAKIRFGIFTWEFCGKLQSVLWLLIVVVVFSLISCSIKMFLHHLSSLKLTMIKYASWTFGLFAH